MRVVGRNEGAEVRSGRECVAVTTVGKVAVVTLDRPERANALDRDTDLALHMVLEELDSAEDVECILLTGSGRFFCAGADVSGGLRTDPPRWSTGGGLSGIDGPFWRPEKVMVALINGPAVGAGVEMALACDFVLMARTAFFRVPEAAMGLAGGAVVGQRLVRQLPFRIALELIATGADLSAADALRWGLVNDIVEPSDLRSVGLRFAEPLSGPTAPAIRVTCAALREAAETSLPDALRRRYSGVEEYARSPAMAEAIAQLTRRR